MQQQQQLPLDVCDKICEFLQPIDARVFVEATDANWTLYRAHYMKQFLKKRIRSIQYTQYDSLSNPRERENGAIIRVLIEMTYRRGSPYSFNSYWLTGTLDDVVVPSNLLDITREIITKSTGIYICHNFHRFGGDITKGFIIRGKNISKIRISINNQAVWEQHYDEKTLLWVQPFRSGISYLPLIMSISSIEITADTIDSVKIKGLFVDTDDRRRLSHEYSIVYYSPINLETGKPAYTKYNIRMKHGFLNLQQMPSVPAAI